MRHGQQCHCAIPPPRRPLGRRQTHARRALRLWGGRGAVCEYRVGRGVQRARGSMRGSRRIRYRPYRHRHVGLHAHGVHAGQPSHCVCEIDVCGQWRRYSCKGTLTLQWLGSGSVMSVGFNRLSSDPAASNKAAAVVGEGPSTNQTNLKTQESDL